MNKKDFYNSVTDQVKDLEGLATIQSSLSFNYEKLKKIISEELAKSIRRVIITGCGDSYSAAGAMLPGFKALSGLESCDSPPAIDFCLFDSKEQITLGCDPEQMLVIGISFSGGSARVGEALKHAEDLGTHTLLITRNSESACAKVSEMVFDAETPAGCNTPGLRSYYASMVSILAIGAYIGVCKGSLSLEQFVKVGSEVTAYTYAFMADFERIDDQMFEQAQRLKDLKCFEVIADGEESFSAQFIEEKIIECAGVYCDHINSEEFAHISIFFRDPSSFGTMALIHKADPSMSRMLKTIHGCLAQHRPTIVVTDDAYRDFSAPDSLPDDLTDYFGNTLNIGYNSMANAIKPVVCKVAHAPYSWMAPLMDFVPGSLLAGYYAAVNETNFFAGRYDFRTQTWNPTKGGNH